MKILNAIKSAFYAVVAFIAQHKITSAVILAAVAGVTAAAIIVSSILSAPAEILSSGGGKLFDTSSSETVASVPEVTVSSEEEPVSSEETPVSSETPTVSSTPQPVITPSVNTEYNYNSNMSYDNNVFLDALKYTGYKTDPRMWGAYGNYVLCSQKRGLGWLSEITYDDYGSATGYEVNEQGLPDIHYFTYRSNGTKRGLVCASYVAYVYFNYLPNVAGIDTSMLPKAGDPVLANEWYIAAQKWVDLGYSRYINFTANDGGSIYQDLKLTPEEDIPIGSLIFLCDWYNRTNWSTHVSIYAGKVNGYHWVTHVGNENGPELCAIERMNRLPHPQWMLAIITPPSNIRFSAAVEVTVKDESGKPMKDVSVSVKRKSNGVVTELGKTNADGKVSGEGLSYDEYEVIQTVPSGYTCGHSTQTVTFTTKNNSLNTVNFTNKKEEKKAEIPSSSESKETSNEEETDNSSDTDSELSAQE
ncbi:MAG: hypothetical protein IJY79_07215 [Clostridia bacterium]|nr:hypothetical protein [Clostridia bacterium]